MFGTKRGHYISTTTAAATAAVSGGGNIMASFSIHSRISVVVVVLACIIITTHSSSPSQIYATVTTAKEGKYKHTSGAALFRSKDRTIVSGFGSRSVRKSIFSSAGSSTYTASSSVTKSNKIDKKKNSKSTVDKKLTCQTSFGDNCDESSPKIWVKRSNEDNNALWIMIESKDIGDKRRTEMIGINSNTNTNINKNINTNENANTIQQQRRRQHYMVLKLSCNDDDGDYDVRKATPKEESDYVRNLQFDDWIPIEGLYGLYKVPSGILLVLITATEPIYEAPPILKSPSPLSWWNIRRVTNLEIVHLAKKTHQRTATETTVDATKLLSSTPPPSSSSSSSSSSPSPSPQLREEVRQLKLLRKALKQHDFYYIPQRSNHDDDSTTIIRDMTKTIQQSILDANNNNCKIALTDDDDSNRNNNNANNAWWRTCTNNENHDTVGTATETLRNSQFPDPRFFWNQCAVEPILKRFRESYHERRLHNSQRKQEHKQSLEVTESLLQHVIPLTSAFVGVQTNITVDINDTKNKNSSSVTNTNTNANSLPSSSTGYIPSSYDEILISRRSRFRAGTRFTVRGADEHGDCANFAETEQICLMTSTSIPNSIEGIDVVVDIDDSESSTMNTRITATQVDNNDNNNEKYSHRFRYLRSVASHVQTRGSIPLRWSSPADVKTYRPRVHIGTDPLAQARAVRRHILNQLSYYSLGNSSNKILDQSEGSSAINEDQGHISDGNGDVADIVFVNLVDKTSDQGRLGRTFDAVLNAVIDVHGGASSYSNGTLISDDIAATSYSPTSSPSPSSIIDVKIGPNSVKHVWYDFHAEVKSGRWNRLGLLLEELQPTLKSHDYFLLDVNSGIDNQSREKHKHKESNKTMQQQWSIRRLQNAVVRTNCMDCLDRTNVIQSIFGRYILFQQLSRNESADSSNINSETNSWAKLNKKFRKSSLKLPWTKGETAHRLLWADNADAISRLYAGTPALKGDFTRTGERTKRGALDDGMNSLHRYYKNNFLDSDRQEGYDLMVGHASFSNVIQYKYPSNVNDRTIINKSSSKSAHQFLSLLGGTKEIPSSSSSNDRISNSLPLRWLPGDLQAQMRNQAKKIAPVNRNHTNNNEESNTGIESQEKKGGFCFKEAIRAIDERSVAEKTWWAKSLGGWLIIDGNDDDIVEDNERNSLCSTVAESSQHKSQIILTPIELALVLVLGLQAPIMLSSLVIIVLSYVYMPECIKHDTERMFDFVDKIFLNKREDNSM